MLGRRFLLLVAVLMGLTALAASIAPREPLVRERGTATPSPTPTAEAAVGPATPIRTIAKTVSAAEGPAKVTVHEGDLVHLTVESSDVDSVSVLGEFRPVEPESPAEFDLLADEPGSYPIELLDAKRRISTLVVRAED
jgi:hypothetical protein